ncbi:MAG: aldehyde dehydrogenase family protein [Chitinophagaceae bacterium]|nr:MAG: aldehyde dehydrogenase family protein [Chitinophagaceae bacterium]
MEIRSSLEGMRRHIEEGGLRSYEARVDALKRLKAAVLHHEGAINDALMADLGKSVEETWVTETGFLLTELTHALKHLKGWMRPEKVHTNLLNLPSKSRIYKEPLGVVCIIGPWNYPLQLLLAPLVGALAAGNAALLKPSEFAPATASVVRRIVESAFRAEEVSVLEGDGAAVIPPLLRAFRFDHIFYTGSTFVGQKIYALAAEKLVPVTLELGGKSPCVIEPDADLKVAARRIAMTKFSNAGQMCVAPDYVLVHASVRDAFVEQLTATIRQFFTDDPARSGHYGKIVNERAFQRLHRYLAEGTVLFGGKSDAATLYIEPTLIGDLPADAAIMGEEIFGPLLPILTWTRFEEARALIRRNADPLAFYVFTQSKEAERRWIEGLPFGGGCVNNASWHLTNPDLPFGGRGKSGIGAYHGRASFDTFSHRKSVLKTPTWFDPSLKYPPFKGKLSLFKKVIR